MLAKSIRKYLENNGIEASQLSIQLGISENELGLILNEKQSLSSEMYLQICCALHKSVNYFTEDLKAREEDANGQEA